MRPSRKLLFGAAAGVIPLVLGQGTAGAATASDTDGRSVSFTSTSGATVTCELSASHQVDTEGELVAAIFVGSGGSDPCRGRLGILVFYPDAEGDERRAESTAFGADGANLFLGDIVSTQALVRYGVDFDSCSANCTHQLETETK